VIVNVSPECRCDPVIFDLLCLSRANLSANMYISLYKCSNDYWESNLLASQRSGIEKISGSTTRFQARIIPSAKMSRSETGGKPGSPERRLHPRFELPPPERTGGPGALPMLTRTRLAVWLSRPAVDYKISGADMMRTLVLLKLLWPFP
jgi:hypothetical protein